MGSFLPHSLVALGLYAYPDSEAPPLPEAERLAAVASLTAQNEARRARSRLPI